MRKNGLYYIADFLVGKKMSSRRNSSLKASFDLVKQQYIDNTMFENKRTALAPAIRKALVSEEYSGILANDEFLRDSNIFDGVKRHHHFERYQTSESDVKKLEKDQRLAVGELIVFFNMI